jgi:hypothetical protein
VASLAQLRKNAKELGLAPGVIRGAETVEELQAEIDNFNGVTKAVVRKKSTRTTARKKVAVKKATARKTVSKSRPAVKKSTTGKAKRSTAAKTVAPKATTRKKTTRKVATSRNSDSGRNMLDGVDYGNDEGWNARPDSAPDRIIKALKRYRGNRAKVYDLLEPNVWDFVGRKKANGEKRTKAEALDMLAYRISRTAWDFAMRTGQHSKSENRVQYGTGGTGSGAWKPARSRKTTPRKTVAKKSTAAKSTAKTKTVASRRSVRRKAAGSRR